MLKYTLMKQFIIKFIFYFHSLFNFESLLSIGCSDKNVTLKWRHKHSGVTFVSTCKISYKLGKQLLQM